jgi:hypothetical protein
MIDDPIIDEIRKYRAEYAARFNHDVKAMVEDAKRQQQAGGRQVVRLPSRPPQRQSVAGRPAS